MNLDVYAFNTHGYNSNISMVEKLVNSNDVMFLIEHWLPFEAEHILSEVSVNHRIIFE